MTAGLLQSQNLGYSSGGLGLWNYVGFWFHSYGQYNTALTHPESPFLIADDITSLVVLLVFSALQAYASFKIFKSLAKKSEQDPARTFVHRSPSNRIFAVTSICVFAGHLVVAVLFLASFALKLRLAKTYPERTIETISVFRLEATTVTLAQVVILLADALLVYRCYIVCRTQWVIWVMTIVTLLGSLTIFILNTVVTFSFHSVHNSLLPVLETACSVLLNIIVTISITTKLILAQRKFKELAGRSSNAPYARVIGILLEAALPPALVGLIICTLTVPLNFADGVNYTYCINILWFSCTALAPQLIAVRVLHGNTYETRHLSSVPTLPLAFTKSTQQTAPTIETSTNVEGSTAAHSFSLHSPQGANMTSKGVSSMGSVK
ncbi:hypothetical protein BKA70DRAFT_772402 [Coprinopsis sp. MPI-PUGE-AT-0042]|nr:hypothetical protein BKA70DRAFT_772402 [Coprinopsis sp. MPI-PUGE-AT-0042]